MKGVTHRLVAGIAFACLDQRSQEILYPRWRAIQAGATLTDEVRAYWDPMGDTDKKHLVHRCYVDSVNPKDHGAIEHLFNYSTGTTGFVDAYLGGDLDGAYDEITFLENFGMYLGIVSHHICDICTPVHVGHKLDYRELGYKSLSRFHQKVERDIARIVRPGPLMIPDPELVSLTKEHFWSIAETTYSKHFTILEDAYLDGDETAIVDMTQSIVARGLKHTVDVWSTIMVKSDIWEHEWTVEPLV